MNGALKVLDLATGTQLYSFSTHGYIMSSAADVNGQAAPGVGTHAVARPGVDPHDGARAIGTGESLRPAGGRS